MISESLQLIFHAFRSSTCLAGLFILNLEPQSGWLMILCAINVKILETRTKHENTYKTSFENNACYSL